MADLREFTLPDLGEGLEEGEVVAWLVDVGDHVELNQEIVEVETAKAVVAVPCPFAGELKEKFGQPGETLEVGAPLCRIAVEAVADDVETGDVAAQTTGGSPAQAATEATAGEAAKAAPAAAGATADDGEAAAPAGSQAAASAADAETAPQPLVGYGEGKAGGGRRARRRRGGGTAGAGTAGAGGAGAGGAERQATTSSGNGRAAATTGSQRPLAKPPVRKLAKDLGIDLAELVPGSGPDGIITRDDVHAAAEGGARPSSAVAQAGPAAAAGTEQAVPATAASGAAAPARAPQLLGSAAGEKPVPGFRGRRPGEVEAIQGVRKRIVAKMEQSRREIPEATCSRDADITELWELRRDLTDHARAEGFDVKITPFALVMRATVLALRRFPTLNARIDRDAGEIHLLEPIHLGFAADTDRGLMVPNIKDAHAKSLLQLALELADLAGQARDGSIGPGDLTGGTFTVNNYGAFGNDDGDPIINHPEGAILGVGAMRERPWVVDGAVVPRRVCRFTLAFDHRICDGGEAGRFVTYVADLCSAPSRLLLHS